MRNEERKFRKKKYAETVAGDSDDQLRRYPVSVCLVFLQVFRIRLLYMPGCPSIKLEHE